VEQELRNLLRGDPDIAAQTDGRVNWTLHPQGAAYPALVLNVVSDLPGLSLSGPTGLFQGRVQIDAYALSSIDDAIRLGRAVTNLLHGHAGGGFRGVWQDGRRTSREGGTNEATRPYRVSLDFVTNWRAQ